MEHGRRAVHSGSRRKRPAPSAPPQAPSAGGGGGGGLAALRPPALQPLGRLELVVEAGAADDLIQIALEVRPQTDPDLVPTPLLDRARDPYLHQLEQGTEGPHQHLAGGLPVLPHRLPDDVPQAHLRSFLEGGGQLLYVEAQGALVRGDLQGAIDQGLAHQARVGAQEVPLGQLAEVELHRRDGLGPALAADLAAEEGAALLEAIVELPRGALEVAVLDQPLDQLVPGVELLLEVDLLARRQERAHLDRHQGGRHEDEVAGQLEIDLAQGRQVLEVAVDDAPELDLVDVHLLLAHEVQEEVHGSVEDLSQPHRVVVLDHQPKVRKSAASHIR